MALALAGADLAGAAEVLAVEVGGKRAVRFHAAAGERNHLTVTVGKAGIRFADPSIVTRAATGCRQAARGEAVCEGERVEIRFGDVRIGRRGPVAVAEPRLARTPIRLALPHGGRTRVQLFGRRLCEGDSIFVPLFRIAGR